MLTSAIMLLGTFAMSMPYQEAAADHAKAEYTVFILKNGERTDISYGPNQTSCAGRDGDLTCNVVINLNNRDENRFNRICGSDTVQVVIPGGVPDADAFDSSFCNPEHGPWGIEVFAETVDSNGDRKSHDGSVTLNVTPF